MMLSNTCLCIIVFIAVALFFIMMNSKSGMRGGVRYVNLPQGSHNFYPTIPESVYREEIRGRTPQLKLGARYTIPHEYIPGYPVQPQYIRFTDVRLIGFDPKNNLALIYLLDYIPPNDPRYMIGKDGDINPYNHPPNQPGDRNRYYWIPAQILYDHRRVQTQQNVSSNRAEALQDLAMRQRGDPQSQLTAYDPRSVEGPLLARIRRAAAALEAERTPAERAEALDPAFCRSIT